jgi:hypothetical protein
MEILGEIRVLNFLKNVDGEVTGRLISDAKDRFFQAQYTWEETSNRLLNIKRYGSSETTVVPSVIQLDRALIAFFGLYSGDGAKGSEDSLHPGRLRTSISFSQREPNLVKFAVVQFKRIFPEAQFTFSLGEDSAYFMAGEGLDQLKEHYRGDLPPLIPLSELKPDLREADIQYLAEHRPSQSVAEEDLAFYYQFKDAMQEILTEQKLDDVVSAGVNLSEGDRVTASLRRPYKKGAREPGGSSRSDETYLGNVSGMGELFLKMLHELEETLFEDNQDSTQGLIHWFSVPSEIGEIIDIKTFFEQHPYGSVAGKRPIFIASEASSKYLEGMWQSSKKIKLAKQLRLTPLWCYTAGLYLAEGRSPKSKMFEMFSHPVTGFSLGFTSSENTSLGLILRALQSLFTQEDCVEMWKVKVGSQYFPELVVVGLKNTVPMLRGGNSGDGKLRTMEISIAIKNWALAVAPVMEQYKDKYSHVEPTGAGVPRIDFSASSALCKWYFPLVMYAAFGKIVSDPINGFQHE